jgi:pimeloyl-ACP methyl ester carboxylesterase
MSNEHILSVPVRTALLSALLSVSSFTHGQSPGGAPAMDQHQGAIMVTSKDGTRIAYERLGRGPALILVGGALSTRADSAKLARLLADDFTVYSYDRRGRGDSGDTRPYAVSREIEDLAALIVAAGGSSRVYGKSSGASLALEAASRLGERITQLAIYEAPYSAAHGAAEEWKAFRAQLDRLLAEDRRADAVIHFMKFVGAPDAAIAGMTSSPAWAGMQAMAPTLAYDNAVVGDDRSVPVDRVAKITASTLVMDGGASVATMPFMRPTADTLAETIPGARRRTIDGQDHDVDPNVLAPILLEFFR